MATEKRTAGKTATDNTTDTANQAPVVNMEQPATGASATDAPATDAPAGQATPPPPPPPTVEDLKAKLKELAGKLSEHEPLSKEFNDVMAGITDVNKAIAKAQAEIAIAAEKAKIAEELNARIALANDLVTAVLTAAGVTVNDEQRAAFQPQLDAVVNELTAKFAASAPASTGAKGASNGKTGEAILSLYWAKHAGHVAAGKSEAEADTQARKDVIDTINPSTGEKFSRGTVGAVVLADRTTKGLVK